MRARLFLAAIAFLASGLVFAFERIVSAGGGSEAEQASFQASFKFGQDARNPAYKTEWHVQSAFTDSIQFHTVYMTMPTQIVTRSVGELGYSDYVSTDLANIRYPRGFQLISSGTGQRAKWLLASAQWFTECLPGPEIMVELHEFSPAPWAQVIVRNTTPLWLNLYNRTGTRLRENPLRPGGWQTIPFGESGSILVKVLDQGTEKECAVVSWTLPASTVAPTPTSTPRPITITLGSGWQLISMPMTRRAYLVDDFALEMVSQGISVTQIVRWRFGLWESHITDFPANNYPMETGRPYFLRVLQAGSWLGQE